MIVTQISTWRNTNAVTIQKNYRIQLVQSKFYGIMRLERRLPKVVWHGPAS